MSFPKRLKKLFNNRICETISNRLERPTKVFARAGCGVVKKWAKDFKIQQRIREAIANGSGIRNRNQQSNDSQSGTINTNNETKKPDKSSDGRAIKNPSSKGNTDCGKKLQAPYLVNILGRFTANPSTFHSDDLLPPNSAMGL